MTFTGLFIVLVWGAGELQQRFPGLKLVVRGSAVAVTAVLAVLWAVQISYWRDNETLFKRALAVTENDWFAHISVAAALASQGDLEGGVGQYREALRIRPQDPILQNNMAFILGKQGKIEEAEALFLEASRRKPDYAEPVFNIGVLHLKRNDFTGAERQVAALDALDRDWADTLRGYIRFKRGVVSGTSPAGSAF